MDLRAARRYDWEAIQQHYDSGHTFRECMAHFGFSKHTWHEAKKRGDLVTGPREMPIEQLLCGRRSRAHLKGRLIKAGLLAEHCQSCGIVDWHDRPLALELHHVNGDGHDNRLENLSLLCPNCHSQTDSWGGRNRRRRDSARGKAPKPEPHSTRRTP
jgi:5-methylcytosine-specific restriction endonuclease McrA